MEMTTDCKDDDISVRVLPQDVYDPIKAQSAHHILWLLNSAYPEGVPGYLGTPFYVGKVSFLFSSLLLLSLPFLIFRLVLSDVENKMNLLLLPIYCFPEFELWGIRRLSSGEDLMKLDITDKFFFQKKPIHPNGFQFRAQQWELSRQEITEVH